jgi:drug/metabolite transporter (DMT)-like permease
MALIAAITWAVYSVFTRQFGKGVSGVPLFLVATAAVLWVKYVVSDEPAIVLQVCVMGVLMATAYSCWNHGIQHGDIALLATMSYFTPVLSMLLATVWLKVMPDAGVMYGVAFVTLGSMLSGWASKAKKTHALNA